MENPATELKTVIRTLTQGTPDEQEDAIYRHFAPGASFEHPFCRVPSVKNTHVPGVGDLDSRVLISAIYKWYKILSPRITLNIESCVFDEETRLAFVKIHQVFSIWFIPCYHAPVDLVTVLHLEKRTPPSHSGRRDGGTPPPPYDAAQEKRQAVQEGAEPSYASVAAGEASASTSNTTPEQQQREKEEEEANKRWYIAKQQDLYQVNEFVKFVALGPGAAVTGFFQLFATLLCLMGAVLLGPFLNAAWPARNLKGEKEKKKQKKST